MSATTTPTTSAEAPPAPSGVVVTPGQNLRWQVIWTMVGSGLFLVAQYGMLVSVAKLGTPDMVGEFSLALAIATPVMVLSQMQLRQILVTDAHQQVPFADYFWTRLVAGLCGLIIIMGLGAVLRHDPVLRMVTIALAIARLAESLSDILNGSLQRREHMGLVAVSMTVRGLAGLVALAIALKVTASIYAAAMALGMTWLACVLLVDLPLALRSGEHLAFTWHPSVLVRMVRDSAPLTIAAGLLSLSAGIPRYFLDYSSGKAAVAILAVAMMPISLMGLFTGAVSQATLARASAYLHAGRLMAFESLARRLTLFNFFVGLCLVVLLGVAGRQLVHFLYTPEYDAALPVMMLLGGSVAVASVGAFGSVVITAGRRFQLTLVNVLVALAVQVPLCWLLVPRMGVMGAAWAECGKYVATATFLYIMGRRVFRSLLVSQRGATC